MDHIIAEKHGGLTTLHNLAFACAICNRLKGTDIASMLPGSENLVRLFNPRIDMWNDHFQFEAATCRIHAITDIGKVTDRLLGLNSSERILERQALVHVGHYPMVK